MYPKAPGNFTYNVEGFFYAMKVTQYVGTCFNLFTIFIIIIYSSAKMKDYKYHLLLYQISSAAIDFGINTLAQPIMFFPYLAGTAEGWLRTFFGMHTFLIFIFMASYMIFFHYFVGYHLLFHRWQLIIPIEHFFKIKRQFLKIAIEFVFCTAPAAGIFIFFYPAMETYEDNYIHFRELYSEDIALMAIEGFYCVGRWSQSRFYWGMAFIVVCLLFLYVTIGYYIYSCNNTLNNTRSTMSQKTRAMHLTFLRNLFLQVGIPLFLIQLPVVFWGIKTRFSLFLGGQDFNNFLVWVIAVHGWVGSFFLLYLNHCYWMVISRAIKAVTRKLPKKSAIVIMSVS